MKYKICILMFFIVSKMWATKIQFANDSTICEVAERELNGYIVLVFTINNDSTIMYQFSVFLDKFGNQNVIVPASYANRLVADSIPSLKENLLFQRSFDYFGPDITPEWDIFDSKILRKYEFNGHTLIKSKGFYKSNEFPNFIFGVLRIQTDAYEYKFCNYDIINYKSNLVFGPIDKCALKSRNFFIITRIKHLHSLRKKNRSFFSFLGELQPSSKTNFYVAIIE